MVIAAAARRRDMLAWQIARGVRDKAVTSLDDLTGTERIDARAPPMGAAQVRHNFRLWKFALKQSAAAH